MFIKMRRSGYDRHGEQVASGRFLILMHPDTPDAASRPLRALVRFTSLRQFGNFMMGRARVGKHTLILSGSYGSDGLPTTVPAEVYEKGVELPKELYEAWKNGGGWNGAGSEADAMRKWALETFDRHRHSGT